MDSEKKACVNIENNDIYSFKWAVISALYPIQNHNKRMPSYNVADISANNIILPNRKIINFGNLQFPLNIKDIEKFEELNADISINVFGYEEEENSPGKIVGPYYITKEEKDTHINLLLLQEEDKKHYAWMLYDTNNHPTFIISTFSYFYPTLLIR